MEHSLYVSPEFSYYWCEVDCDKNRCILKSLEQSLKNNLKIVKNPTKELKCYINNNYLTKKKVIKEEQGNKKDTRHMSNAW